MALADILRKLDSTLSNWQNSSSSIMSNWSSALNNLSNTLTKPPGSGQQGPNAPPSSGFGQYIFDILSTGSFREKTAALGGAATAAGIPGIGNAFSTVSNIAGAAEGNPESIIALSRQAIESVHRASIHMIAAGGHAVQALTSSQTVEQAGTHTFGAVEQLGNAMGPFGGLTRSIGTLGRVAFESVERLRAWNDQLYRANIQFADFSASMAGVQARQEFRDIIFSRERGEQRADSAEYQAQQRHGFNQRLAPIEDAMANFHNILSGAFNEVNNKLFDALTLGVFAPKDSDQTQLGDTQGNIDYVENLTRNYGVPQRFKRP